MTKIVPAHVFLLYQRVLQFKIAFTLLGWAGPMLLLPVDALQALLGEESVGPAIWLRMLGIAYIALCFGYYGQLLQVQQRTVPDRWSLYMGLFSNAGAAAMVTWFLCAGAGSELAFLPALLFRTSVVALVGISAGIIHFCAATAKGDKNN